MGEMLRIEQELGPSGGQGRERGLASLASGESGRSFDPVGADHDLTLLEEAIGPEHTQRSPMGSGALRVGDEPEPFDDDGRLTLDQFGRYGAGWISGQTVRTIRTWPAAPAPGAEIHQPVLRSVRPL